ncbi:MAG: methyl-accepting chemotaxis protein [Oscillospiraceae bacterium]
MKNSMRIGAKITIFSCAAAVVTAAAMAAVAIVFFMNYITTLQKTETGTGVNVLRAEVSTETDALGNICRLIATSDDFTQSALNGMWAGYDTEGCDGAYYVGGSPVWHTADFPAGTDIPSGKSGLILRDNRLLAVSSYNTSSGTLVDCKDMSDTSFVDSVKEKTGAELTLFLENVRYSTTLLNSSGERNIGTTMDEGIWQTVQSNEVFIGQATINGQNYYVNYSPIDDIDGNVIGAYFAGYSTAAADKELATVIIILAVVLVALCAAAAVMLFIAMNRLVKQPVAEVVKVCGQISSGALDSADPNFTFANDEMGEIASRLTDAKHKLHTIIGDISRVLSYMAEGDFTQKPGIDYMGNFNEINHSFRKIQETLSGIIGNINTSSEDVTASAQQMSDGSQLLAEGTTEQATAVDELSSTIADISDTIARTAENANKASEISTSCADRVTAQGREIENMLAAMDQIQQQSNAISEVIKTIEDIAFQTNILALNAAIEAARAGEAGKGFAVVADEVRNLASKSAESANSTKELISATIEAVENGSGIAHKTAETMNEVIKLSQESAGIVADISTAADQQAEAVKQVTIGIDRISQVVSTNSATAEQSAASCEELSAQARILKEQIERLRI